MKKAIFYIAWYVLLITVQTTVLSYAEIFNVKPNLPLIFIILLCYFVDMRKGVVISGIMGLLYDVTLSRYFGVNTLMFMYTGLAVCVFNERVLKQPRILISLVSVFVFSQAIGLLYFLIYSIANSEFKFIFLYMTRVLPESIYNTAVAVPMYFLIKKTSNALININKG